MRLPLFILTIFFNLIALLGQDFKVVTIDSISGGSLMVSMDKELSETISRKVNSNCKSLNASNAYKNEKKYTDPCKAKPKVLGYKIQIFHSNNRTSAEKELAKAKTSLSYLSPELVYTKPSYRVLLGDYFAKSSASKDLTKVRRQFSGAFMVQWRVWCRKAK